MPTPESPSERLDRIDTTTASLAESLDKLQDALDDVFEITDRVTALIEVIAKALPEPSQAMRGQTSKYVQQEIKQLTHKP